MMFFRNDSQVTRSFHRHAFVIPFLCTQYLANAISNHKNVEQQTKKKSL